MTVEKIYTRPATGRAQVAHRAVHVVAGSGIEGDRYFGVREEPGQNLTLVEAEEIESFLRERGRPLDHAITGRNVVTRGVRLNELVGREFCVGAVRLLGVALCQPCLEFGMSVSSDTLTSSQAVRRWVHRAGLRADVLQGGEMAVGDPVGVDVGV